MDGMQKSSDDGIPSLFEFHRLHFPGWELVGYETPDGRTYSVEELKALEGQENKVENHQKAISSLERAVAAIGQIAVNPQRTIKRCFHVGNTFFAIASDDTAWYLRRMDKLTGPDFWEQLHDATTPALPQNETVVR
jgi:hypothetical protein